MKKNILFLFFTFLFLSTGCIGQVSVVPKLGFNLANMTIDPSFTYLGKEPAVLFHGGAGMNVGLSDKFSLQPEILFTQKGVRFSDNYISETLKTNYLEIPVMLKFSFGNETTRGFISGGPFAGYALSQKLIARQDDKVVTKTKFAFDNNLEDDGYADNRLDLGIALGTGVQFQTGPGSLFIEIRYDLSLNSVERLKEIPNGYSLTKNKVVMIGLGYLYPLNGN